MRRTMLLPAAKQAGALLLSAPILLEWLAMVQFHRRQSRSQVRAQIGAIASPDHIHWAPALPKTRSGKARWSRSYTPDE